MVGARIAARRKELNMSQDELAKRMGYKSRSTINKIELGINDITQSKIAKFAAVLDTTPADLMGWDVDQENKEKPTATVSDGQSDIDIEITKKLALLSPEMKEEYLSYLTYLLSKQKP